jgi:hypothetical protein
MQQRNTTKGNMNEMTGTAKTALMKIIGLRMLKLKPSVLAKAEQKVIRNLNLDDMAAIGAALAEVAAHKSNEVDQ